MIIFIGILSGFLVMFINYCLGKPGSKEFSPYEIFSFYTVWLSRRRLDKIGLLKQYTKIYYENINDIRLKHEMISFKKNYNKSLYEAAEQFFTWERALGMCSVCSGFWTSLGVGMFFAKDFTELITIVLISHITIRLLNKVI